MVILYGEFHWFSYVTGNAPGQKSPCVLLDYNRLVIKESYRLHLQTGDTEPHPAWVLFRRAGSRLNPVYCMGQFGGVGDTCILGKILFLIEHFPRRP